MQTATQMKLPTGRLKTKKNAFMTGNQNTVPADAIQAEWAEIQLAQRNSAAFRPLYNRYYEPIFRFIHRRLGDEMLAGDVCAQVFLKAIQKIKTYQFKGVPFSAWLYRIASNEVSQHFRNIQKSRTVSVEDSNISDMLDEVEIDDFAPYREILIETLEGLKEKEVQLIEMRFFEHRPFKEIAQIMNITESNAKVRTYRTLEKLKKKLVNRVRD